MKILALVASQDSTVEDVKTNGRRQMQALIGKDKEVLFCEYSTIEICRNGELAITCLGEKMEKPDYFCENAFNVIIVYIIYNSFEIM